MSTFWTYPPLASDCGAAGLVGSRMTNVVPLLGLLSTVISPPISDRNGD